MSRDASLIKDGDSTSGAQAMEASTVAPLVAFLDSLLAHQVELSGAEAGVVWLRATRTRKAGPVAIRQDRIDPARTGEWLPPVSQRIERVAESLGETSSPAAATRPIVEPIRIGRDGVYQAGASHLVAIVPLSAAGTIEGFTGLLLRSVDQKTASEGALRASLAGIGFEAFLWQQNAVREGEQRVRLKEVLELTDAALQGSDAKAMCAILCHELRRRYACERVSIGLIKGESIAVAGISGADTVDTRSPAAETLRDAMEECAIQDTEIFYPKPPESEHDPMTRRITIAHERLSQKDGPSSILSLPLRIEGDLVGVMVLERPSNDPFPPGAAALLRLVAEFIGPAVWTRRLADRGVAAVARDRCIDLGRAIVGPRHTGWKLVGAILLLAFLGLAAIPIPDRVRAQAEIRAITSRTIPPPFNGYFVETLVKPGDHVRAGDVLGRMDISELTLQLEQERGKREVLETERDNAHASGDLSTWRRAARGIDETDAKIALLQSSIARAEVRSPIDGVVSRGDLDDFVGARVEPTMALFEVVSPGRLAILRVDERDARRVKPGQRGWIVSAANPARKVPIIVERINPSADADEGANVFRVEASISDPPEFLNPGTRGRARLRDGWTTGLAALARPIVDEIRLRYWW